MANEARDEGDIARQGAHVKLGLVRLAMVMTGAFLYTGSESDCCVPKPSSSRTDRCRSCPGGSASGRLRASSEEDGSISLGDRGEARGAAAAAAPAVASAADELGAEAGSSSAPPAAEPAAEE